MRLTALCLVLAAGLGAVGCGRKPAYSDINVNQAAATENKPAAGESNPLPGIAPGTTAAPAAPADQQAFKLPRFMDPAKTEARDLPNYPRSVSRNVRYGPYEGTEMFAASLQTPDPMEKVAAFYDEAIKRNGWTVTSRIVDPEYSEWIVNKNQQDDAGKVVVQKDKQSNSFFISIARTGKPAPEKPAPAPKKQS